MKLHLNCDMGERGHAHADDLVLLELVDCVNIAVGGHAGDARSARDLARRAADTGRLATLHLSYPDREHFGRRSLALPAPALRAALEAQRAVLPELQAVKLHGALYNQAAGQASLAQRLVGWLLDWGIDLILAPPDSALHAAATAVGMRCLREGFADRGYTQAAGRLVLLPRDQTGAVHDAQAALRQVQQVQQHGRLAVRTDAGPREVAFACDTWCVHGDHQGAVGLTRALRRWADALAEPPC